MTLLQTRITELAQQHGSLRAAARALGVDPGYLSRLSKGEKTDPTDGMLARLGLCRVVSYERTDGKAPKVTPRMLGLSAPLPNGSKVFGALSEDGSAVCYELTDPDGGVRRFALSDGALVLMVAIREQLHADEATRKAA